MRGFGISLLVLVVTSLLVFVPEGANAERSQSRNEIERELGSLRDSLHEAHLELAKKADRIAELEAVIGKRERPSPDLTEGLSATAPMPPPPAETSKKARDAAALQKAEEVNSGRRDLRSETRRKLESKRVDEVATFVISYELNSAVNYDGREAALQFVREHLKAHPGASFSVMGYANDSAFRTKDLDIAGNRARFLVDYLVIRGVHREVFTAIGGETPNHEDEGGRVVIVTANPED